MGMINNVPTLHYVTGPDGTLITEAEADKICEEIMNPPEKDTRVHFLPDSERGKQYADCKMYCGAILGRGFEVLIQCRGEREYVTCTACLKVYDELSKPTAISVDFRARTPGVEEAAGTVHYLKEDQCFLGSDRAYMACGASYLKPSASRGELFGRVRNWERLDGRKWSANQSNIICEYCWDVMTEDEKETFNARSTERWHKEQEAKKEDDSSKD